MQKIKSYFRNFIDSFILVLYDQFIQIFHRYFKTRDMFPLKNASISKGNRESELTIKERKQDGHKDG